MKILWFVVLLAIIAGCSPRVEASVQTDVPKPVVSVVPNQSVKKAALPDLGLAPELSTSVWLNTSRPLRLSELRGKVVLLEMWTYGCINCRNVIPSLKEWHSKYAQEGLVIIGNHFPEFDQERDLQNLITAVEKQGILYPVTQDNDGLNWLAYNNMYWPTLYLMDKNGHIRYTHIGEGSYEKTEQAIQALLVEM